MGLFPSSTNWSEVGLPWDSPSSPALAVLALPGAGLIQKFGDDGSGEGILEQGKAHMRRSSYSSAWKHRRMPTGCRRASWPAKIFRVLLDAMHSVIMDALAPK